MKTMMRGGLIMLLSALYACVTVNVYFPAAAVEEAADRLVKEIYNSKVREIEKKDSAPAPEGGDAPAAKDKSSLLQQPARAFGELLTLMVPPAYAQQPDIEIDTPAINQLKGQMQARHGQLVPFYDAGAVGLAATGLLVMRDAKAVSLKDRGMVQELVAQENADRNALYREIANANGHPEWEPEIRTIFDRRWVANAPGGWWFQDAGGSWVQK
jgi:uncharacterized protein